ncbi:MAG: RNA 2',3'-cyclic phosphodiesterase [Candidatus Bathyarchaeia archaeon]
MSQERIRSFIAVDLDEPMIRERLVAAQKGLEQTRAQLKIVEPQIMHMTLRFLGEVPMATVERVKEAMDSIQFPPFEAEFTGLGVFPNPRRINVVWVGIKQGGEELSHIFQELEPKLRQIGLPPDDKGFSPHMTIARVRSPVNRDALAAYVESMKSEEFGKMAVNAVRLKKSTLTPRGPIYTTIHEVAASS